ncbi:thiamin pyrophosphokinase-like protein 1 [Glonium stellatum]|uniref:Thiamine pyrophosphokinase n=1 Tax=Glonium stellatum TaxID=574774 RepID=A0A8E2ER14_9PEZI|nr:thiamin pyrophosphokinase-like protein 1 [Glonium stellatum]
MDFIPAEFLDESTLPAGSFAPDLLILNQPIANYEVFERLWRHTRFRICADGGANRLYDMFNVDRKHARSNFLPSIIHGDLDSLRDDVRQYYSSHGVEISQNPDQYSTDLGKAMRKIMATESFSHRRDILILGTLSGRVDQGLGLLHEMVREETENPNIRLWLFSETNVSFILREGCNNIQTALSAGYFTCNVGIIPIYGPATITTSGLEWDVTSWPTRMGYQVSTSNHSVEEQVRVETDAYVLFTMEREPRLPGKEAQQAILHEEDI